MRELEEQGVSTAAIRNRSRRMKAWRKSSGGPVGSEDVPCLFNWCGVGLAFGDASEKNYEEARIQQRQMYEERKKAREAREAQLRSHYRRQHFIHQGQQSSLDMEAYEVME